MRNKIVLLLYRCIIEVLLKSLRKSNILQLKCKNNKLQRLISQKPFKRNDYNILVVNLSSEELDVEKLRYGLHHSYTNKNKYIKRDIAVEFETLATILDSFVNQGSKETFHEYLRSSTKVIANNVYQDPDNTFKSLNNLRNNSNIMILSANKETCTVILNRTDYIKKVNAMIDDGISQGKYVETVDNTHQDLKHFQNFLYRHFYKTEYYDKIRPISNQPARFFATAKSHKFNKIEDINIQDLKLRPIIDQTSTYIYSASKVIANYLKPLAKNNFIISDALSFPDMLKKAVNSEDYENVSYDVDSLFSNIPVKETIEYILHKTYVDKSVK